MAIIINPVSDKRFSVNNIQYLKNYVTAVHGSKIEIFNCYERSDVLVPLTHYGAFRVEGVTYPNALALQSALLPILYSRSNLGGDSPDIDQDNLDVVRYVRSTGADTSSILAAINALEMYTLDDKQSLWFVVAVPGTTAINGRIGKPNIYKYKMLNYGKGTYGQDAFLLEDVDIELVYATAATLEYMPLIPGTQHIPYGNLTDESIRSWFINNHLDISVQHHNQGYTLFEGTINGVATTYLWLGADGPHHTNAMMPLQSDFLALHDLIPVTYQDNLDIKKTFILPDRVYDKTTILAILNDLPAYTVNDNQSVWFVGSELVNLYFDNPRPQAPVNPLIVKYKMLNKGKGIYGLGYTRLDDADIELVYSNEATLNDLEAVVSTQIIRFTLSAGQTVSQWLNNRTSATIIQPQEDGYTIFKSTVASDGLAYLWLGNEGSYGSGRLQSVTRDFQLLNETIIPVNQDNIAVKKFFSFPYNYTTTLILRDINRLDTYEVKETDSVWFIGTQQPQSRPGSPTAFVNPLVLKYKMFNKGKGWYGQGGIQLDAADIELISTNEASLQDMEAAAETVIINVALSAEQTVSEWLNTNSPSIIIRPQEEGYTIFKDTTGEEEESWLWTGTDGRYGSDYLQSDDTDFQVLNKAVIPQDQDNIDIRITFNLIENNTTENLINSINRVPTYTVSEKQSVWFVGQGTFRTNSATPSVRTLTYKYKMLNKGKGTYGRGGTRLDAEDIELVYFNEASSQDLEASSETDIVTVTLATGESVSQWLNIQSPSVTIQPQEEGYTIFKDTGGEEERSWLWIGNTGRYGFEYLQSTDADFQILSDAPAAPYVPTINEVLRAGDVSNTALSVQVNTPDTNEEEHKITYSANAIIYQKNGLGGTAINFEDPLSDDIIEYRIPAKPEGDVFAMRSDFHRPVKPITTVSTGFENGTYTLQASDKDKWLLFMISSDFIIKVNTGIFAANTLLEGETGDSGQATFVSDEGIILHHGASELPKTAEMNSVFGLKFRTGTDVSLFGKLELL